MRDIITRTFGECENKIGKYQIFIIIVMMVVPDMRLVYFQIWDYQLDMEKELTLLSFKEQIEHLRR